MRYSSSLGFASMLALSVMLAACGGGGGGSSAGSGTAGSGGDESDVSEREVSGLLTFVAEPSDLPMMLGEANLEEVAAALFSAVAQAGRLADETGGIGPLADLFDAYELGGFDLATLFANNAGEFLPRDAQGFADGLSATDCPLAGSSVLELVLPESDSESDRLVADLQFNDCDFGDGLLLAGGATIDASGIIDVLKAGLGVPANVAFGFSASDLSVHRADAGFASDGRLEIDIRQSEDGSSLSIVSPERFSYAGETRAISLQRFSLNVERDMAVDSYSIAVNGALGINYPERLNGTVTMTMLTPFSGSVDYYPDAGELLVSGSDGRELTLLAGPNGALTISLDKGDGEAATVVNTSWESMAEKAAMWQAERLAAD